MKYLRDEKFVSCILLLQCNAKLLIVDPDEQSAPSTELRRRCAERHYWSLGFEQAEYPVRPS